MSWQHATPRARLLLHGAPGTGKTDAVRAIVTQALSLKLPEDKRFTIFAPKGSDIQNTTKAQDVFKAARERQPSIVFMDECEKTVCGDRTTQRVNDLKICITNLAKNKADVLVIMATNKIERIDSAIMDRMGDPIELPLPSSEVRRQIIESKLKNNPFRLSEDEWNDVLTKTGGKSGRWLTESLCQQLACVVASEAKPGEQPREITHADFSRIIDPPPPIIRAIRRLAKHHPMQ